MKKKTFLLSISLMAVFIFVCGLVHVEAVNTLETQSTETTGQINNEQALQKKVQKLKSEIGKSKDKTAYNLLKDDLEKAKKDVRILEEKIIDNKNLMKSNEDRKNQLETRLEIRERQLSSDPTNPDLQNEVESLKKQIDGENGIGGLNNTIREFDKKIESDRLQLEKTISKRDQFQKDFNSHTFTQKQKELAKAKKELADLRNKKKSEKLIQRLNEMNRSTSTFSVQKYLSVGRESDIELIGENEKSNDLISSLIRLAIQSLGTFAIVMMIVAGYFMIVSEGDENRIQKGKNIFLYTIIGLLVAFTSYALVQFVLSILFQ